ncbi:MAG TPA: hypothetical protein VFD73_09390, partial [Gemmatimonadales bacterium]|nr:hypothetical protein [Gemmatimonadales bacterium]
MTRDWPVLVADSPRPFPGDIVRSDAIALVDRPLNRRCVVALSDQERIEAQRETVRQHIAGENDHDW